MAEHPQHVKVAALKLCGVMQGRQAAEAIIAEACAAERELCAQVADRHAETVEMGIQVSISLRIADAIRARQQQGEPEGVQP